LEVDDGELGASVVYFSGSRLRRVLDHRIDQAAPAGVAEWRQMGT
jgi:hypothetical protein